MSDSKSENRHIVVTKSVGVMLDKILEHKREVEPERPHTLGSVNAEAVIKEYRRIFKTK